MAADRAFMADEIAWVGEVIDDKYRIETLIGSGSMGAVYRAICLDDDQPVAIKFMTSSLMVEVDEVSVVRFEREARAIARLKHPNILRLHGYGRAGARHYLAMQYIGGGDLSQLIQSDEPLDLDEVGRMLGQLASALDYAHEQQVIHRDIKPANVLLDDNHNPILADFGLARIGEHGGTITGAGILLGTPAYMAPELAGEGRLTPSIDLYALACILYQMLTHELPFQADTTVGFIMQHIGAQRPDICEVRRDLPTGLTLVMRRALARDVAERYPTGAALLRAYRDALLGNALATSKVDTGQATVIMDEAIKSPFKGLEAFQEADAPYFYGREQVVQQLIDRLRTPGVRFLPVLGASGSGKSSLVRAGLIPALRKDALQGSGRWPILVFTPGSQPLRALANQLQILTGIAPGELVSQMEQDPEKLSVFIRLLAVRDMQNENGHVVLVIDQFEEIFTRAGADARDHFLAALLHCATVENGRAIVVLTMRADFYHHVTSYPDVRLAALFQDQQVIARAMTPAELRHAIEAPADAVGLHYEGGLVETILADIAEEPGSLPLLQYALQELFRDRRAVTMTRQAYEMTGGVLGALARRAETIYTALDSPQQALMRRILLRLVEVNEAGEITRRRVERDQLIFDNTPDEAVEDIVQRLTHPEVRLLTANREWQTGAQWIDVSHEALIQRWERLQLWVRENLATLLIGGQLLKDAQDWHRAGEDPAYLLRGVRLDEALRWLTSSESDALPVQRQLITASVTAREQEQRAAEARRQHEIELERGRAEQAERVQHQLRIMLVGAVVFIVIALGLSLFAFTQMNAAQTARAGTERKAAEVESLALSESAEKALQEHNHDLAMTLALTANQIDQPPLQAQQTLAEVADTVGTIRRFEHADWVASVAYSPDGKLGLTGGWDNKLHLWDVASGKEIQQFSAHTDRVSSVAFSPDGKTILSGSWDNTVRLWDVASGKEIRQFTGHTSAVSSVAFSPDGLTILSGSWDNTIRLWDVASGKEIRRFTGHTDRVSSVAFSPNGLSFVSGSWDNTVRVWSAGTGKELHRFTGHTMKVLSVAFSPDGLSVLSGSWDRTARLWNVLTGQQVAELDGHTKQVTAVAFSPDGQILVTGSADDSIRLWNAAAGKEIRRLDGHTAGVLSVAFSHDSKTVLSGAADNSMRLWDVEIRRLVGHSLSVSSAVFSPDGKLALSASADKTLILWDVVTGAAIRRFEGHTDVVESAVFSPDGKTAASAADDGLIILWDVATGKEIRRFVGHSDWVANAVFSPDGKYLLSSSGSPSEDKSLILWDVASGKEIRRFQGPDGHTDTVLSVVFSPDGKTALSGSWDNTLILWDVASGKEIRHFVGHKDRVWIVAMSPDGKLAASASTDGTVRLWDIATGQEIRSLIGHTEAALSVAFSPDGKSLLSGSEDHTVRLWDVATGKETRRFEGHTDRVWGVAFSSDGQLALSASADKTIRVWRLARSLDELIQWTHANRYVRDLTCDERAQYRVDPLCEPTAAQTALPESGVTATPASGLVARQGDNRGKIAVGGGQVWTFTGKAFEILSIRADADKPANEAGDHERRERGLLDTRLVVRGPDGSIVAEADDTVTEDFRTTDSLISRLVLPADGTYQIEVRSFGNETGGAYTVVIQSQGLESF